MEGPLSLVPAHCSFRPSCMILGFVSLVPFRWKLGPEPSLRVHGFWLLILSCRHRPPPAAPKDLLPSSTLLGSSTSLHSRSPLHSYFAPSPHSYFDPCVTPTLPRASLRVQPLRSPHLLHTLVHSYTQPCFRGRVPNLGNFPFSLNESLPQRIISWTTTAIRLRNEESLF